MNSKQRRKDKRLWKYSVKMTYRDYAHYEEMWGWLKSRYGSKVYKCGWRDRHAWYPAQEYNVEWQFLEEKRMVEFMLRWL
jgi:hypothetical protein